MSMRAEIAGPVLKLDSDPLFAITSSFVGNAIREAGANLFDSEL